MINTGNVKKVESKIPIKKTLIIEGLNQITYEVWNYKKHWSRDNNMGCAES